MRWRKKPKDQRVSSWPLSSSHISAVRSGFCSPTERRQANALRAQVARLEELARAPGMNRPTAETLYQVLHA